MACRSGFPPGVEMTSGNDLSIPLHPGSKESLHACSNPDSRQTAAHRRPCPAGIVALFLLLDGVMKLVQPQVVIDTTTLQLGYPQAASREWASS
jgi:hypothetical protein